MAAFTTLLHSGKPVLKYSVGDVLAYTEQECPCGRTSSRVRFLHRHHAIVSLFGSKFLVDEILGGVRNLLHPLTLPMQLRLEDAPYGVGYVVAAWS